MIKGKFIDNLPKDIFFSILEQEKKNGMPNEILIEAKKNI